jgi:hypothetical protein
VAYSTFAAAVLLPGRGGRTVRLEGTDIALLGAATFRIARLVTKDRIAMFVRAPFAEYQGPGLPGEVRERLRPDATGPRRAIGRLLLCPHCLAVWIATALVGLFRINPRIARGLATVFAVVTIADALHLHHMERAARLEE